MDQELFRKEALEARTTSLIGRIKLFAPVAHDVWTVVACALAGALLVWLVIGHYTRRVHVVGSIVPTDGVLTLNARSAGTVVMASLREGARVRAGDVLFQLSGERVNADGGNVSATIVKQIRLDDRRLESDSADLRRIQYITDEDLHVQADSLRARLGKL